MLFLSNYGFMKYTCYSVSMAYIDIDIRFQELIMKHAKLFKSKKQPRLKDKTGLPPGTLVHIGEKLSETVSIDMVDYGSDHCDVSEDILLEDIYLNLKKSESKTWVRISGLHDETAIESLGEELGIHPLVLEDIMNTTQRTKVEDYDDYLYIVVKSLSSQIGDIEPGIRQVSIILSRHYVISFHEHKDKLFDIITSRIKVKGGRFRKHGVDYLLYAVLDISVDQYLTSIEKINDEIIEIERQILIDEIDSYYRRLHELRQDIIHLRGKVTPLEELLQTIIRDDDPLVSNEIKVYFRDVLDHARRIIDSLNHFEEITMGLYDMYMTRINFRSGEIMKVLTIIATIFIPLTFIAGIYGMNFDTSASPFNMPELRWYYGYPTVLLIMFLVLLGMLFYFRKKKWL